MQIFTPLLSAIAFAALTAGTAVAGPLADKLAAKEPLRIGFANEAPFSFASPDGSIKGSDIVVLEKVLGAMGAGEFDAVLMPFGSLIPALKSKRIDIIASGLYIRPDRCTQVSFAEPVFAVGDAIVVPAGNPKGLHSLEDIAKDPSLKLGYTTGAAGLMEHAWAAGVQKEQTSALADGASLIAALKAGRIDAFLYPSLSATALLAGANDPAVERASPFTQTMINGKADLGVGSFAMRLEDADFVAEFNKGLTALVQSADYLPLIEEFGFSADDIPTVGLTTAALCAG